MKQNKRGLIAGLVAWGLVAVLVFGILMLSANYDLVCVVKKIFTMFGECKR